MARLCLALVIEVGLAVGLIACGPGSLPVPPSVPAVAGQLSLWQDGEIFRPVTAALASPGGRVWVEMYEFGRLDLARLLEDDLGRGADVRVITDPSVAVSARTARALAGAGVPVRFYPIDSKRHQIDHVKLLLTGREAVVGGMNWGATSDRNHDYAIRATAAAWLARFAAIFEQDWSLAGGKPAPSPDAGSGGPIAQTTPGEGIRHLLEGALLAARGRVDVEIFDLTDPDVIADLALADRRGVLVRVLMDPNQDVNRPTQAALIQAGVQVRWYPIPAGALLHAKIGLFDGTLILGSANWSRSGLSANHELDVETSAVGLVSAYEKRFEEDWAVSG